jgi:hypothetical protein
MQQLEESTEFSEVERKRLEAVVMTLATLGGKGNTLAEVAHDARNMVTALGRCNGARGNGCWLVVQQLPPSSELKTTAAGLLLHSQLALAGAEAASPVAEKLRVVADLAGSLRQQLNAPPAGLGGFDSVNCRS